MIEKNINATIIKQEISAGNLVNLLDEIDRKQNLGECTLYHKFPFYRDENGDTLIKAHILFVSQRYGVLIFDCVDSIRGDVNLAGITENLSIVDNIVYSKLIKLQAIQLNRRQLKINITPVIFINEDSGLPSPFGDFRTAKSESELKEAITENLNHELSDIEYSELKSIIEGSRGLIKVKERTNKNASENSKGKVLSKIEAEIISHDIEQKRAAFFTIDGPQRIRGLAGSGKTIILTKKAALMHLQNPNADILYTYYTKALHDLIKKLITRCYRQYSPNDPNWDKIHIMHAWGGAGLEGVYYNACLYNGAKPINYETANIKRPNDPFGYVCEELNNIALKQQYDYTLIDEAQDFPKHFYRLCRQITKNNRVIWAYDDFQNILRVEMQNEKETFGKDENGNYYVDFSKNDDELQDIVLHKCYRNPREILVCAFALGLGIYNDKGKKILQRLENNKHWEDLGFEVEKGNSEVGAEMIISRPIKNSPLLKNKLLKGTTLLVQAFPSFEDECDAVAKLVFNDIQNDLLATDITIISLDNRYARKYFQYLAIKLEEYGVRTFNLLEAPSSNTIFRVENHVTLSTIYRAKGNESGSVYVVGIDAVFRDKDSINERNKLFTAMTRSMAWLTMTGIGDKAEVCIGEINMIKDNKFKLVFTQPSVESTKTILRDITVQQEKLNNIERKIEELAKEMGLPREEILKRLSGKDE